MKKLLIVFLSTFCIFICGCNYQVLNPNYNNSSSFNDNSSTIKTMYIKLKVEGSSQNKAFVKSGDLYAKEINIQANNTTSTYYADFNNGYYMCNNKDWGRTMTTGKYI